MTIEDVEASMVRYLYTNLTIPYGIKVLEDLGSDDPDSLEEWVVIDSLANPLGLFPTQHWFIHVAVQKDAPNQKQKLNVLTDKLVPLLEQYAVIDLYSYETGQLIGDMFVSECSLSQVTTHRAGGMMRTFIVSCMY